MVGTTPSLAAFMSKELGSRSKTTPATATATRAHDGFMRRLGGRALLNPAVAGLARSGNLERRATATLALVILTCRQPFPGSAARLPGDMGNINVSTVRHAAPSRNTCTLTQHPR